MWQDQHYEKRRREKRKREKKEKKNETDAVSHGRDGAQYAVSSYFLG
jgi:hypothetical protein